MAKRDLYDVLGVPRTASADEIKRAYRAAARKHHPDVNKSADAAKKFSEIQSAYDVLSDEQTRARYDAHGHDFASVPHAAPGAGRRVQWSDGSGAEFEDLGSIFDAIFGGAREGGQTDRASPGRSTRSSRRQNSFETEHRVPFRTAAMGGVEHIRLSMGGSTRSVEVTIPPGTSDGDKLRIRSVGPNKEDVVLRVRVEPDPVFRRPAGPDGASADLYIDVPLTFAEAALGATVTIPTLSGTVDVTVPPACASGRKLRLRGQGIPSRGGEPGDLYGVIRIVPPKPDDLSSAEREAIESASRRQPSPRSGPGWPPVRGD